MLLLLVFKRDSKQKCLWCGHNRYCLVFERFIYLKVGVTERGGDAGKKSLLLADLVPQMAALASTGLGQGNQMLPPGLSRGWQGPSYPLLYAQAIRGKLD